MFNSGYSPEFNPIKYFFNSLKEAIYKESFANRYIY